MKPKDLKCPFLWKDRQALFSDRVLYVPDYYDQHANFTFPEWQHPLIFGNCHPVEVEFCSGNGDWVVQQAQMQPRINWVAVEMRFDRVRKIWSKMKNAQVNNMIIVCGEAFTFLQYYLKNKSINRLWVNFPDPWPKRRHAKNRLIRKEVISAMKKVLVDQGEFSLTTDDYLYLTSTIDLCFTEDLRPLCIDPYYEETTEGFRHSWFERLWINKGKKIYYTSFQYNKTKKNGI